MTQPLPLVLLPGLHGTTHLLRPLIERLQARRSVLAIDYLEDVSLDLEGYVDFVRARLPERRFAVLGESFSGPIAIAIAAQRADTAGLILASTFARFPMPGFLAAPLAKLAHLRIPPRLGASVLGGRSVTPELIETLTQTIAALPPALISQRVRVALGADMRSTLAQAAWPLLCLTGTRDRLTGRRALPDITAARPDAEVVLLDAGHMLLETHAGAAAERIERFLNRIDGTDR